MSFITGSTAIEGGPLVSLERQIRKVTHCFSDEKVELLASLNLRGLTANALEAPTDRTHLIDVDVTITDVPQSGEN